MEAPKQIIINFLLSRSWSIDRIEEWSGKAIPAFSGLTLNDMIDQKKYGIIFDVLMRTTDGDPVLDTNDKAYESFKNLIKGFARLGE